MATIHASDTEPGVTARKPSAARQRVLDTADRLFYSTGIRAVGVDRVIAEAHVARVTFFRHFPTKDDLVIEFLTRRAAAVRLELISLQDANLGNPRMVLDYMAGTLSREREVLGFRGCEFINTAAEFCDRQHPSRAIVAGHRAWLRTFIADRLAEFGHPLPSVTAELMLMLRTGATVAASLEDAEGDGLTFYRAWSALIDGFSLARELSAAGRPEPEHLPSSPE